MQRFKAVSLLRRNHHNPCFLNQYRTLGSLPDSALTDDLDNQVSIPDYPSTCSLYLSQTVTLSLSVTLSAGIG